ncbi:ALK and LTK ligand 2b isoform 1-T1 [Aulostomus maculatus]
MVTSGLLLLLLPLVTTGRCMLPELRLTGASLQADRHLEGSGALELVGRHTRDGRDTVAGPRGLRALERRAWPSTGLASNFLSESLLFSGFSSSPVSEGSPQDKDKFIRHLTGPLYFNPKCRKHFHRLYHNTRDCTLPAYYKRCARLLIRLANSPRCTER